MSSQCGFPATEHERQKTTAPNRREFLAALGAVGASLCALTPTPGHAIESRGTNDLNERERSQLKSSGNVERAFEFTHLGNRYLGALSYSGVARGADRVYSILNQPQVFPEAWPATREARFVRDDMQRLRVVQGSSWINGEYTLAWHPDDQRRQIRFWLDPTKPRDVEDIFGFFRVDAIHASHCVLTCALACNPGSGAGVSMFRGKIHDYMLRPARYIRRWVHRHT